jgi:hypothetical protein
MLWSLPEFAKLSGARQHPGLLRRYSEFKRKASQTAAPLCHHHQKKNGPVKMSPPGRLF